MKKGRVCKGSVLWGALLCLLWASPLLGKFNYSFSGFIESDIRFTLDKKIGSEDKPFHFYWNQNAINVKMEAEYKKVSAVANLRVTYIGFSEVTDLQGLMNKNSLDPFWVESDAAYIHIADFIIKHLDLTIGRTIVNWGAADIFNPTSNVCPNDYHDPLKFGQKLANQLVKLEYSPFKNWSLQLVYVPVFRPAWLPASAVYGVDLGNLKISDQELIRKFETYQYTMQQLNYQTAMTININTPDVAFRNGMYGAKLGGKVVGIDFSFSYFNGYSDIPQAGSVKSFTPVNSVFPVEVNMYYPRMQVFGFDFETELPFLGDLGIRGELAVFLPNRMNVTFEYPVGPADTTAMVASTPFVKATIGLDYTFTSWLYANVMYLRGFPDEFGVSDIHNYIVAGVDFKFFSDKFMFRIFHILNVDDLSFIIYPEFTFSFWNNIKIFLGALFFGGEPYTKFAHAQTGPSQFFLKGRFDF